MRKQTPVYEQKSTYRQMPVLIKLLGLASLVLLAACSALTVPGTGGQQSGTPQVETVTPQGGSVTPQGGSVTPQKSTPAAGVTMVVSTAQPATGQPSATNTPPAPQATVQSSGTLMPPLPGSVPSATPGVTATAPAGQGLSVTLADDGKTVNLKVGQRFLLNLGEGYDWNPTVADQTIVSRVIGILVIRGAQGIYEAHAPGTTTLTATGDPTCRKSKPVCGMPSRLFKVTIVVEP